MDEKNEAGHNEVSTADLLEKLKEIGTSPWADWGKGKGGSPPALFVVTLALCEDSHAGVGASVPPRLSLHAIPQTRQELPHGRLGLTSKNSWGDDQLADRKAALRQVLNPRTTNATAGATSFLE